MRRSLKLRGCAPPIWSIATLLVILNPPPPDGTLAGSVRVDFVDSGQPITDRLNQPLASLNFTGENYMLPTPVSVIGWGQNQYGRSTMPAGIGKITTVALGATHSLALKSDRTVVAWGSDRAGQLDRVTGCHRRCRWYSPQLGAQG